MNVTKMVQCGLCLAVLCGVLSAAPAHWRENIVYQTTAGKAQPAVLLPGITSAVPPAPALATPPATPATTTTSATPALNKGTLSALQSAHDATATPLVTTTTPTPATRATTTPVATATPRGLSTTSKAAGASRSARTSLRRASGSVDHFVDRNNDGYDDRTSSLDL
ncbi:MAG: hypothetical protein NTV22_19205 [bacterium]|nr:hypothetical protein [bacterium]